MAVLISLPLTRQPSVTAKSGRVPIAEVSDHCRAAMLTAPTRVVILKSDWIYAEALQHAARVALSHAKVRVATNLAHAAHYLEQEIADVLITGVVFPDGDALHLLDRYRRCRMNKPRVLVVTTRKEQRVLATLRQLPIEGVFDPTAQGGEELVEAIRRVASGGTFWSGSVLEELARSLAPTAICRVLTPSEQRVLSVIGDGSDDEQAAQRLDLKATTVASIRRQLHRKLNVQHKGALVRLAVQHGFVRFTAEGAVRPGFSVVLTAAR